MIYYILLIFFKYLTMNTMWNQTLQHSNEYINALSLSKADMETIRLFPEELTIEIEDKIFSLSMSTVCGSDYGASWKEMILCICKNDETLNIHTGFGTCFINFISDEWHQKLMQHLTEDFKNDVRQQINDLRTSNDTLWKSVSSHSQEYKNILALSKDDLEILETFVQDFSGAYPSIHDHSEACFLSLEVEGTHFNFFVKNTCCCDYGASWEMLIQVASSDKTLNTHVGRGTCLINTIPDESHQKLISLLSEYTQ
jgi:hypothetical protein